jgi:hypothetical protein
MEAREYDWGAITDMIENYYLLIKSNR